MTREARRALNRRRRFGSRLLESVAALAGLLSLLLPVGVALWLAARLLQAGAGRLDQAFLQAAPSAHAHLAGLGPAIAGSFALLGLTALLSIPAGVGAAIYLEEYEPRGRVARLVELNLAHLAGMPPILFGLLGLGLFVRTLGLGVGLGTGAVTLGLLVLPGLIQTTRLALREVPSASREACVALGATPWQTIRQVVLPCALAGICRGAGTALSRALGEATPLIALGALAGRATGAESGALTTLPTQIFDWVTRSDPAFVTNAAAACVVLLAATSALHLASALLHGRLAQR